MEIILRGSKSIVRSCSFNLPNLRNFSFAITLHCTVAYAIICTQDIMCSRYSYVVENTKLFLKYISVQSQLRNIKMSHFSVIFIIMATYTCQGQTQQYGCASFEQQSWKNRDNKIHYTLNHTRKCKSLMTSSSSSHFDLSHMQFIKEHLTRQGWSIDCFNQSCSAY